MNYFLIFIVTLVSISLATFANETDSSAKVLKNISSNSLNSSTSDGINIDSNNNKSIVLKVEQEADSTVKNEIVSLFSRDQIDYKVKISLTEYNVRIKLLLFNMLGNLVEEVYVGIAVEGPDYPFDASNLPNGLYLCILEGPNFRDAEKFTISR